MQPSSAGKQRTIPILLAIPGLAVAVLLALAGVLHWSSVVQAATTRTYPGASAPCNTTLQACISGSAPGDTVNVLAGTFVTGEIVISQVMTLRGAGPAGTILQAQANQRVISVSAGLAGGVVIADLRVAGGDVAGSGGGIASGIDTPLKLVNVEVLDNAATDSGGGVYAEGRMEIAGGRVERNVAAFGGGGAAYGDAEISGTVFLSNTATGDAGGFFAGASAVTVTGASFISNTAAGSAGGLWAESGATVAATDFLSNTAGGTGGGLQVNGGDGVVTGGRFVNNRTGPVVVDGDEEGGGGMRFESTGSLLLTGVIFQDNRSANYGGGLVAKGFVTVAGGLFEGNTAASSGGGIFTDFSANSLAISSTAFTRNEADFGGGIYSYATLAVTGTDFLSNTGNAYGGGLFTNRATTVTGGRFSGNQTTVAVNGVLIGGGAIYNDSGTVAISGAVFAQNESAQQGGALLMTDSGSAAFQVTNGEFVGNRAQSGGGVEGAGSIALVASRFEGNVADTEGGAVLGRGPLTISSTTFTRNSATFGGAVVASDFATVTNSVFLSNTASSEGGALASVGHSAISGSRFDRNRANLGGALWLGQLNGNAVDRSIFSRNAAQLRGGAIHVTDSTALTLTNSLLVSNTAGEEGGGIASLAPGLHVLNTTLAGNQAGQAGGAIRVLGGGRLDLGNAILWGNSPDQIASSVAPAPAGLNIIQGGAFGGLNQDPRFVRNPNPSTDDLGDQRLRQDSPAIDRGDNARLPANLTLDLDGRPRRFDVTAVADMGSGTPPIIDLGAYEVNSQVPSAEANGPYTGNEGAAIPLSGLGSTSGAVGQAITAYAWDCTDDGTFDVSVAEPAGVACGYTDQGSYTARLRVTNAGGFTAEDTAAVTVQNVPPALSGQIDQNAVAGRVEAFLLGGFADPGADAPWQAAVTWGDGQADNFTRATPGVLPALDHTYTAPGSYTVTVTVTDKDGGAGSADFVVSVTPFADATDRLYLPRVDD